MENALQPQMLNLARVAEDVNPEIEKIVTEDDLISQLANQAGWEALKDRIHRKMQMIENNAKVTNATIGAIDSVENFGFKCMVKDLLIEAYQGIIDDVDETYKFLKEKKDAESAELQSPESTPAE